MNKTYRLEVASTVQSTDAVALGEDYTFTYVVGTAPGVPVITTTNAVDDNITAKFNQAMDASTFTQESVKVERLDENGNVSEVVPGAISYDTTTRTVTFNPTNTLAGSTQYRVTLAKDLIKNSVGISLQADKTQTFTTAVSENLFVEKVEVYEGSTFVEKTSGDIGVKVAGDSNSDEADIKITLDKGIKASSLTTDSVLLYNKTTGVYEDIKLDTTIVDGDTEFTFGFIDDSTTNKADDILNYGNEYEIILVGITDNTANENLLPEYKFGFKTETGAPTLTRMFSDVTGGTYTSGTDTLVTEGITNINAGQDIYIEFANDIEGSGTAGALVQNTDVKLYNITDSKYETLAAASISTKYLIIGNAALTPDKQYKVIVEKTIADDITNVGLDAKIERTFTTVGTAASTSAAQIGVTLADGTTPQNLGAATVTNGTLKTALNKPVKVTFGKDILASSINANTVKLIKVSDGSSVDATRVLDSTKRIVTITPKAPLEESTKYTVEVTEGLKDSIGNKVTAFKDLTKTFTTVAQVSYTTNIANNATGVSTSDKLEIQFNKAMTESTVEESDNVQLYTLDSDGINTTSVALTDSDIVYDINTYKATINKVLDPNKTYILKLKSNAILDKDSNVLNSTVTSLTEVLRFSTAVDAVAPSLVSAKVGAGTTLRDLDGAKSVAINDDTIKITFDEDIANSDLTTSPNSYFSLINQDTQAVVNLSAATASFATGANGTKEIDLDLNESGAGPATVLVKNTNYRLVVSNLEDASENKISPVTLSFTTGDAPIIVDEATNSSMQIVADETGVTVTDKHTIVLKDSATDNGSDTLAAVSAANVRVFDAADNSVVSVAGLTAKTAANGKTIEITLPKDTLAKGKTYKVMLLNTATDKAGNPISNNIKIGSNAGFVLSFSTELDETTIDPTVVFEDTNAIPKTITQGDELVAADTDAITATFAAGVDFSNLTAAQLVNAVEVYDLTDDKAVPVLQGAVTVSPKNVITINPVGSALTTQHAYRVTIKQGIVDNNGAQLKQDVTITFSIN